MPRLNIVLTDGFEDDHVEVSVDGRAVLGEVVRTDQRIGVARAVGLDRVGPVLVEARVPGLGLTAAARVAEDESRLEISRMGGELRMVPMAGQRYGHA